MHSVAAGARHHVNMQMRDALVDGVVHADKAAVGAEGSGHGPAHCADPCEEQRNEFGQ